MKARVPKQKVKDINTILNSGILLSIGMIVKNEHKHIENCLKALQPLMEQVPCELIIADTGSTDDTFEICRKYTDKVFHFKWINDFAAARNSTLEKAKGMWYMYLDADEHFDKDVSALVRLVTDKTSKELAASYVIRNYDVSMINYSDFPAVRMARNLPSLRFDGKIHECLIVGSPTDIYQLPTIAHHYGYAYQSEAEREAKNKRNLELMLIDYEKKPDDVRLLAHIIDSVTGDELEKYLFEAVELLRAYDYSDIGNHPFNEKELYRGRVYLGVCRKFHLQKNERQKVIDIANEFFSVDYYKNCYSAIDMYVILAESAAFLDQWDVAIEAYKNYFDIYKKYQAREINKFDAPTNTYICTQPALYVLQQYYLAIVYGKSGRFSEAQDAFDNVDIANIRIDWYSNFLNGYNLILELSKQFERFVTLYRNVQKTNDSFRLDICVQYIEYYYSGHPNHRKEMVAAISESGADDIPFVRLMKLLKIDLDIIDNGDEDNAKTDKLKVDISEYFDSLKTLGSGNTEAVYLALKYKVYPNGLAKKFNYDKTQSLFADMLSLHGGEFISLVKDYCKCGNFCNNISEIYWAATMLHFAVKRAENLPYDEKRELYDLFCGYLADYVYNVYNPELLNDEDILVLPSIYRFGYFIGKANSALNDNLPIEYIRNIKNALSECEEMRDVIAVYSDDFQKTYMNN